MSAETEVHSTFACESVAHAIEAMDQRRARPPLLLSSTLRCLQQVRGEAELRAAEPLAVTAGITDLAGRLPLDTADTSALRLQGGTVNDGHEWSQANFKLKPGSDGGHVGSSGVVEWRTPLETDGDEKEEDEGDGEEKESSKEEQEEDGEVEEDEEDEEEEEEDEVEKLESYEDERSTLESSSNSLRSCDMNHQRHDRSRWQLEHQRASTILPSFLLSGEPLSASVPASGREGTDGRDKWSAAMCAENDVALAADVDTLKAMGMCAGSLVSEAQGNKATDGVTHSFVTVTLRL